jgi:hypothetical protein
LPFANKARRNGVVSLDSDLKTIQDPVSQAVADAGRRRHRAQRVAQDHARQPGLTMESEERLPAVFESAGGFSPTIGILGAVLGLIQVMQHLDNIQEVGRGIAVAFVATIYGVGIANLFFLPFAGKMRIRMHEEHQRREMMLEGVISILEGMNPRMLEVKLAGFLDESPGKKRSARHERATAQKPRQPRSLAGLLCRLHHPAVRFFVVLYAFAKADQKKQVQVSASIDPLSAPWASFPTPRAPVRQAQAPPAPKSRHPHEHRDGRGCAGARQGQRRPRTAFAANWSRRSPTRSPQHTVSIQMGRDGLVISLREAGFFDSGSATPSPRRCPRCARSPLRWAARPTTCASRATPTTFPSTPPNSIPTGSSPRPAPRASPDLPRPEGHAPRAHLSPPATRVHPVAEFHPVASNDTAEGRAENRRVDLVVLPRTKIDLSLSAKPDINPFRFQNLFHCRRNVLILVKNEPYALFDDRHLATKAAKHLRKLEADIAPSNHHQVLWHFLKLQNR